MKVLITYDVSTVTSKGRKRLRKIAKACENYGIRVQLSVFECVLSPDQWIFLKNELLNLYNKEEDSLRFYLLGSKWHAKIEHYGAKKPIDIEESLIY
ncbi:MAG TPA: CRISPR-associated endonuclease Cas2 [Candidatus Mcinerneyibacteriales bacterium]|nr:CRISPR-associated endonuclease Cas2 [Candidatus Mcinerneyibacteriales bacterium]